MDIKNQELESLKPQLRLELSKHLGKFEMPKESVIAGGSVSNILLNLLNGTDLPINDVDVFTFEGSSDPDKFDSFLVAPDTEYDEYGKVLHFNLKEADIRAGGSKIQILNYYFPVGLIFESKIIDLLKYFDNNSVKVAYDWNSDTLYYTAEYVRFIKHRKLIVNPLSVFRNPVRTLLRLYKKYREGVGSLTEKYLNETFASIIFDAKDFQAHFEWACELADDVDFPKFSMDDDWIFKMGSGSWEPVHMLFWVEIAIDNYEYEFERDYPNFEDSLLGTIMVMIEPEKISEMTRIMAQPEFTIDKFGYMISEQPDVFLRFNSILELTEFLKDLVRRFHNRVFSVDKYYRLLLKFLTQTNAINNPEKLHEDFLNFLKIEVPNAKLFYRQVNTNGDILDTAKHLLNTTHVIGGYNPNNHILIATRSKKVDLWKIPTYGFGVLSLAQFSDGYIPKDLKELYNFLHLYFWIKEPQLVERPILREFDQLPF